MASQQEEYVNAVISRLTPDQLLERYKKATPESYGDPNGIYGAMDGYNYQAYQTAKSMLGRDINANELMQILPYWRSGEGQDAGKALLAQIAEREKNSPQALYKKAPEQYGAVDKVVSDFLQRSATPEERDHFGRLLASGEITPYDLQGFIKAQPEYQQTQDKQFREGLNSELSSYDTDFFNKAKENVISRFAQSQPGASLTNNPSLDYALTDLMGNIAKERSKYLAGISADQYQGNKMAAREDYRTTLDRTFGAQDYARQRQDQLMDYSQGRADNAYDYVTQRNDYMDYMNRMRGGSGKAPWGQIAAGALGAGLGSMAGPAGAAAGWQIGSGIGSGFDYYNR